VIVAVCLVAVFVKIFIGLPLFTDGTTLEFGFLAAFWTFEEIVAFFHAARTVISRL
jgi:hypothetical protein